MKSQPVRNREPRYENAEPEHLSNRALLIRGWARLFKAGRYPTEAETLYYDELARRKAEKRNRKAVGNKKS